MDTGSDYYTRLGVLQTATLSDISRAYKETRLRAHQGMDLNDPTANDKLISMRKAYDVLKDPKQRLAYNYSLEKQSYKWSSKPREKQMKASIVKNGKAASNSRGLRNEMGSVEREVIANGLPSLPEDVVDDVLELIDTDQAGVAVSIIWLNYLNTTDTS
jgi:curved DNA-binding protein CbpA